MKSVRDLTTEELKELRSRWYHQHLDDGSLEEVLGEYLEEDQVPMHIVKTYYGDISFVEEDFWCNTQNIE